jgi:hypothetical protein
MLFEYHLIKINCDLILSLANGEMRLVHQGLVQIRIALSHEFEYFLSILSLVEKC